MIRGEDPKGRVIDDAGSCCPAETHADRAGAERLVTAMSRSDITVAAVSSGAA